MNLLCCCCTMAPNTRVTRKWELFAGRNKFYCDGMLMSAPHTGVFYLTCVLITGTSALFFAFDCPFLATRITPAIPIVGAVLYFFTMSSLLRTTFTDPGVIPRASQDEAAYIEKQIEVPNSLNSPTYRPPPRTKEVLVKGQTVKLKYCFTCKIFRPPRASHCSLCDNCVDRFDHHCPWVGNCVGKRNYRFFYMFLVSLAFLAVFIFSCSVTHIVLLMKTEQEVFEVIKKAPFTVIVTFICFFSIWSVIGLAGFHTYLTTSDQTTNEDLKGSFSSKGGQRAINPYSRGNICLNCCHILCGPMTPSLIDRRGIATDDYILQMQHASLTNPRNPLAEVISSSQTGMITNQPIIGGGGGTISGPIPTGVGGTMTGSSIGISDLKPRLYDESTNASFGGVYRPRSYDNLQNGNSNSLAQLVDNEIPLSQIESPPIAIVTGGGHQHQPAAGIETSDTNSTNTNTSNVAISPMSPDDDDDDDDGIVCNTNLDITLDGVSGDGVSGLTPTSIVHSSMKRRPNNLSGSYNNLFNDDYDPSLTTGITTAITTPVVAENCSKTIVTSYPISCGLPAPYYADPGEGSQQLLPSSSTYRGSGRYYKGPQSGLMAVAAAAVAGHSGNLASEMLSTTTGRGGRHMVKSMSDSENVYSNIPNSNIANINNTSDPSLHVYSNLIEEKHQQQRQQRLPLPLADIQKPQTNIALPASDLNTSTNTANCLKLNIAKSLNDHDQLPVVISDSSNLMSSTLLSDDLDLDDPVSAFVVNSRKKYASTSKARIKRNSDSDKEQTLGGVCGGVGANGATSVGGGVAVGNSHHQQQQIGESDCNLKSHQESITSNRLRLLHDTTMIDTALDLDSLDGSSIGNNSQAGLVKTAIV